MISSMCHVCGEGVSDGEVQGYQSGKYMVYAFQIIRRRALRCCYA